MLCILSFTPLDSLERRKAFIVKPECLFHPSVKNEKMTQGNIHIFAEPYLSIKTKQMSMYVWDSDSINI